MKFATRAIHAGQPSEDRTGAVTVPIFQTSTYEQDGIDRPRGGYEYARTQNPTRESLEETLAALDGGNHGLAYGSGHAVELALGVLVAADLAKVLVHHPRQRPVRDEGVDAMDDLVLHPRSRAEGGAFRRLGHGG